MSARGDKTRKDIKEKAYRLFAEKGFKDVTMQDICERTGLSRGGLYRHYESTEQIFLEIVNGFSDTQYIEISQKIQQHIPAAEILDELLLGYARQMLDCENSFSLALCEFYSDPAICKADNSLIRQYENSKSAWKELIQYGIETKEFAPVNPESVFHVIAFAYQGVRMYSKLMQIDHEIPAQIIQEIKKLLLPAGKSEKDN